MTGRDHPRPLFTFTAVLQAFLLAVTALFMPGLAMAEGDVPPGAGEPEPAIDRVATDQELQRPGPTKAKAQAGLTSRRLVIDPDEPKVTVGESAVLRSWVCDVAGGDPQVGRDEEPGTEDDRCTRATQTAWTLGDAGLLDVTER